MSGKIKLITNAILFVLMISQSITIADDQEYSSIELAPGIGKRIDAEERELYHLFPDIEGYVHGRFIRKSDTEYIFRYKYLDSGNPYSKEYNISVEAVDLTRYHIMLADKYFSLSKNDPELTSSTPKIMLKLGLRYAGKAKYDLSYEILNDLTTDYPKSPEAATADSLNVIVNRILKSDRVLIKRGSLLDHSGRTNLIIFSGYYGIWLGIAAPIALNVNSSQGYAVGLLLAPAASIYIAVAFTHDSSIPQTKSKLLSMGGDFGTWQGLGWSSLGDNEGREIIGIGILSGLTGIVAGNIIANNSQFTYSQVSIMDSGYKWCAWFGLIYSSLTDDSEEIKDMLIASNIGLIGAGFAAKGANVSSNRIRLVNLAGIVGTLAGVGLDLMIQVDNEGTAMAVAGFGSLAGLIFGAKITEDYDNNKEHTTVGGRLSSGFALSNKSAVSICPILTFKKSSHNDNCLQPYAGLMISF